MNSDLDSLARSYTRLSRDVGGRIEFACDLDSADALTQALNSPVRHELRACFKTFPPFTGAITHYAMATRVLHPH